MLKIIRVGFFLILAAIYQAEQPSLLADGSPNSATESAHKATKPNLKDNELLEEGKSIIVVKQEDTIGKLFTAFNLLILLINLGLVIYFYKVSRSDRKSDIAEQESIRDADIKRQVDSFWYQKVILDRGLPLLDQFFDFCEEELSEFENEIKSDGGAGKTLEEISKYKDQKTLLISEHLRELRRSFLHILIIIDRESALKIGELINELEDWTAECFLQILGKPDIDRIKEYLSKSKIQILNILYHYHHQKSQPK